MFLKIGAKLISTMVDNRYATALVIGSVLSLLATVYLSVAVGTQHWYQYNSPVTHEVSNASKLKEEFINGDFNEKTYVEAMFHLNGTLGLWWRCILVPGMSLKHLATSIENPMNDFAFQFSWSTLMVW